MLHRLISTRKIYAHSGKLISVRMDTCAFPIKFNMQHHFLEVKAENVHSNQKNVKEETLGGERNSNNVY